MTAIKTLCAAMAVSVLATACSGGGSQPPTAAADSADSTNPAPAVKAGPPAADDVTTLDGIAYASLTGDAAAGKSAFAQCRTCHVTDVGVNRIGPSLAGIIGRKAGSVAGFKYSEANANSGIDWTEEKFNQFLEKPHRVIPKTKMIFSGVPDAQRRADIIAYLKNPD